VSRKATRKESVGCFLFSLPFAALGIFMAYLYFADLFRWARMQTWEEVPARILSADLEVNVSRHSSGDSFGRHRSSSSRRSITYKALAEYEYEYRGNKYKGTKVSRYFGSDNIGNFYNNIHDELSTYENSDKLFRCFVNPHSPEDAILYRQMRLTMLCLYAGLGGIFGGIALSILPGFLASSISKKHETSLKAQHPEEPWKWRDDWIRGEVRTEANSKVFAILAITAWVGIFSIPILAFIPSRLFKGQFAALLALIFPLVGYWIMKSMLPSILQWLRFGRAVFQLKSIPIRPGERLRGIIRTGGKLPDSSEIHLELRKVKKRSGDEPVWTKSSTTTSTLDPEGISCIEVDLEVPEQTDQSRKSRKSTFEWELRAVSKVPGIDLDAIFKIPVFFI
jgi:hypothetical protein